MKKRGSHITLDIYYSKVFSLDHIQQILNQSKIDDILEEHKKLRFAPFIIWMQQFLIGIICCIIEMSVSCDENSHDGAVTDLKYLKVLV